MTKVVLVIKIKNRRLNATFTLEQQSDLEMVCGIDIEKEIMAALNIEVNKVITNQIINNPPYSPPSPPKKKYEILINDNILKPRGIYYV